ncbi:AAA family ATPase [Candidatus Woesearchaeota archaeon]|jgi:archaeal cell division control protein 6|nr:AAA family ATPase [Candidatus Woesearchaeota archaeon]MBT4322217.1 AAA family ATPase [Candidatus Woesearchaeota archaeon]MBT4631237.1 AAA family ATPase [Candidatus Woesearchaeota archaeon]
MGLFDDILHNDESLFINEQALDYDYVPKKIPHRENQQHYIADVIKPLFQKKSGRNLFIFGAPGIGKTVAIKHVLRELEEKTEEIITVYVNCWKKDTSYKILIDICGQLNYKWVHNKRTDELMKIVSEIINKKSVVVVLDEVDRVKDLDILYNFSEDFYKKCILMIANDHDWIVNLDSRIKSRLNSDVLEFKAYNYDETLDILKHRAGYAFVPDSVEREVLELVASKAFDNGDVRTGIFLLRESGNIAEMKASRKISVEHCEKAIEKMDSSFKIKKVEDFGDEERKILDLIKENSGLTIKELFGLYPGSVSYRTFHRKLEELDKNKMISLGEMREKSKIVNYNKKLSEF